MAIGTFSGDVKEEREKWISGRNSSTWFSRDFLYESHVFCFFISPRFYVRVNTRNSMCVLSGLEWEVYHAQKIGTRGMERINEQVYRAINIANHADIFFLPMILLCCNYTLTFPDWTLDARRQSCDPRSCISDINYLQLSCDSHRSLDDKRVFTRRRL